jgi:branched-subunit amino acid transport protein
LSHLLLILIIAVVNFVTRFSFLARPESQSSSGRFLEVFPVALFVSLAARDLLAPEGSLDASPALAAAIGAIVGGLVFRRSILGVVGAGLAFYWAARLLF